MAYEARFTPIGLAKRAAYLTGGPAIEITHVAVGDQDGTEQTLSVGQTDIINEVRRAAVSSVTTDPDNPLRKIIQQAIPKTWGGHWVREASAIDADGDVVVIANLPPAFKPDPSSGASRLMNVKIGILTADSAEVVHNIVDGAGVFATLEHVADEIGALPSSWPDADKLGGNLPAHYATQAALATVANDLATLDSEVAGLQLIPTGTELGYWGVTAPAGYVLASGRTIGSASSGATERANADTQALYELLWASGSDTTLPIFTSAGGGSTRGASAAADFAANKRLSLPDMRGRVGAGKDDMGGTAAGRLNVNLTGTRASTSNGIVTGLSSTAGLSVGMLAIGTGIGAGAVINSIDSATQVTLSVNSASTGSGSIRFGILDGQTLGSSGGAQTHTIASAQMPIHSHTATTDSQGAHTHTVANGASNTASQNGSDFGPTALAQTTSTSTSSAGAHTHTVTVTNSGGGQAHPNVQPSIVRNVIIKL